MSEAARKQADYPVVGSVALLAGVGAGAVLGLCGLSVLLFDHDQAVRATALVGIAAVVAVVLSMLPVALLAPLGVMGVVYGYFAGAAIRLLAFLAVIVAVVVGLKLPVGPALLGLGVYLPLMLIETAQVGCHLWKCDDLQRPATCPPTPCNVTDATDATENQGS